LPLPLIDAASIRRILIIQYDPFGDVLLNTGYLPVLRRRFPDARIEFLLCPPYDEVLADNPCLDEIITFHKKVPWYDYVRERFGLFWRIYRRRYDLVIDQQSGTGSAQIAMASRARYRLGLAHVRWSFAYNLPVDVNLNQYSALIKFDLLAPLGIDREPFELVYPIRPESQAWADRWIQSQGLAEKAFILVSPGSPVKRKKWRLSHYAEVVEGIRHELAVPVVLSGAPGEMADLERLHAMLSEPVPVKPPTSANQAAALLKRARLLLCNDGGMNHLSAAVKTPSLAIFGVTDTVNWAPTIFPHHEIMFNPDPEQRRDDRFGIEPRQVIDRIKAMLDRIDRDTHHD